MVGIVELIWRICSDTVFQALYVAGLLCACAVVLHHLDKIISGMLSQAFGWKSVLWTGWIGTPIHELSHAAMCLVFFHKIQEMVLYNPDPRTGVLGYVAHSYNPRNPWARIGCAFIGMAPLFGGALALFLAMYILVPSNPMDHIADFKTAAFASSEGLIEQSVAALRLSTTIFAETLSSSNLTRWQFWVFLYLVLCIGTHMSPSKADFAGSQTGFVALLVMLLLLNSIAQIWGGVGDEMVALTARYVMPVVALLMMAVVLNLIALAGVFLFVVVYRGVRGESLGAVHRTASPHFKSLAIVAAISLAFFLAASSAGGVAWVPGKRLVSGALGTTESQAAERQNLCGHPASRPGGISRLSWLSYTCQNAEEAGARWSVCRKRTDYAKDPGRGCPDRERCCPK